MDLSVTDIFAALSSVVGSAAVAPSLLILWAIASLDSRREPTRVVLVSFLLGAAGAFLLSYIPFVLPGLAQLYTWPSLQTYLHATFDIAAPEEALKLSVLIVFSSRFIAYDHPMEGAVYGAAVGLGFAAYENLFYLANHPDYWATLALVRGLFTVPVHGALGIITGIYVGKAKLVDRRRYYGFKPKCYLTGWFIASALHGLFDFPLILQQQEASQSGQNFILSASVVVAAIASGLAARIVYKLRKSAATSPNSFAKQQRFRNHPWHLTGLAGITLFLVALPFFGWVQQLIRKS